MEGNNSPIIIVEGVKLLNVPCAADLARECITEDCYQIKSLKGKWAVADIGACYGEFSLLADRLGHAVHAYEPSAQSFETLRLNRELNFALIKIFYMAISKESSAFHLHYYRPSHPAGSGPDCKDGYPAHVASCRIQDAIAHLRRHDLPIFIKMDCEGAEVEIFREHGWLKDVSAVSMETHNHDADVFGKILEDHGFKVELFGTCPYPLPKWDKSMGGGLVIARR